MKVDCLMGTYGRHAMVCEGLACFLQQTALGEATMLIYNQHPVPMHFEHPRVRVVNEPIRHKSLRHVRVRMHQLIQADADLIHWWDDDDLYLPWHLEDCLGNVGDHVAWKPASSWISERNTAFARHVNRFEGSWIFDTDYLLSARLDTHPDYKDHPVTLQTEDAGLLGTTELGDRTSYIYRWDIGTQHLSGYGSVTTLGEQAQHMQQWQDRSSDVRPGSPLIPADLTERWSQYLVGIAPKVSADDLAHNRARLGL